MRITKLILLIVLLFSTLSYGQKTLTWYRITTDTTTLNYNPFTTTYAVKAGYYNINPKTGEQYRYSGTGNGWVKDSLFRGSSITKIDTIKITQIDTINITNVTNVTNTITGVGGVRWVVNWTEFIAALNDPNVRSINIANNLLATSKAYIPTNQNVIKEIEGHGFEITIPATIDTGFVRKYTTLTAANQGIDQKLRFRNVSFKGNNNMCMYLSANYGAKFEGCIFYNFTTALDLRWCMDAIIDQCFFTENYIGVNLDYDRFTGGSNSTSCSNGSVVQNCKFRNSAGDFANIKIHAASDIKILYNIFEGAQAGGDYDIYFDDNGSTVVKGVYILGCHIEHIPAIASIYIKLKEGYAYCGVIYSVFDITLIKFESSAYAKCIVDQIPFLSGGTKFQSVSNTRWIFSNMPGSFKPDTASVWVGGVIPTNSAYYGWNPVGQSPFIQLGNKKVVTQ